MPAFSSLAIVRHLNKIQTQMAQWDMMFQSPARQWKAFYLYSMQEGLKGEHMCSVKVPWYKFKSLTLGSQVWKCWPISMHDVYGHIGSCPSWQHRELKGGYKKPSALQVAARKGSSSLWCSLTVNHNPEEQFRIISFTPCTWFPP